MNDPAWNTYNSTNRDKLAASYLYFMYEFKNMSTGTNVKFEDTDWLLLICLIKPFIIAHISIIPQKVWAYI